MNQVQRGRCSRWGSPFLEPGCGHQRRLSRGHGCHPLQPLSGSASAPPGGVQPADPLSGAIGGRKLIRLKPLACSNHASRTLSVGAGRCVRWCDGCHSQGGEMRCDRATAEYPPSCLRPRTERAAAQVDHDVFSILESAKALHARCTRSFSALTALAANPRQVCSATTGTTVLDPSV